MADESTSKMIAARDVPLFHLFHDWSKWEQYNWNGIAHGGVLNPNAKSVGVSYRRQRRHCRVCGKEQDQLVRNG